MFAKALCQFPPCFFHVDLCAHCIGYTVDGISENACELISAVDVQFLS